jgi:hypothetical protein
LAELRLVIRAGSHVKMENEPRVTEKGRGVREGSEMEMEKMEKKQKE